MKEDVLITILAASAIDNADGCFHAPETFFIITYEERFIMSVLIDCPNTSKLATTPFDIRLQQALADMRRGDPVILMDDFDRENEADLIVAAEKISARTMAMMIRECSGIVCLCISNELAIASIFR